MRRFLPIAWVALFAFSVRVVPAVATADPLSPAQQEFFEQRIRPILANDCYECHGATKQKGGLRLDSRDPLRAGGDSGPALVLGRARDSLLLQSITHEHADLRMPKDRPKLSAAVVADFERWINEGAPDPRDHPPTDTEIASTGWDSVFRARRDWWSFQPVQAPPVPGETAAPGSAHPVDRFIGQELQRHGLAPAGPARRPDLLRRVTFVLTGLPPTPAEIEAFLADTSPDGEALATVVDRLLDSPRLGEHWARHWMDLVRFAETHGSEGDPDIPLAWRYRDYLIRAFNADVPADQLIREHLAGDLLPNPRWNEVEGFNESMLGLVHFRLVEHGFQPVDTLDEQVKTVDNQIDVVSKAFQGLTTSCARCHDHKFDPISQRDYYALYGVFASSRPTQLTIDSPERLRVHREELERLKVEIRAGLAEAWTRAIGPLSSNLLALEIRDGKPELAIPGDPVRQRIREAEARMAELDAAGRITAAQARAGTDRLRGARLVWTFAGGHPDPPGDLQGGAMVRDGRLVLAKEGAFFQSAPLTGTLREKTFEAWVIPANFSQRGGGVITVETTDGRVFDSLVLGEREPGKWMAGSESFRRSTALNAPVERTPAGEGIHLAVVYHPDHRIALFRNGEPYGEAYRPNDESALLQTFAAGSSRVLLGKRHTGGGQPFFTGEIEEVRLYDRALTPEEIAASFRAGPDSIAPEEIAAALTLEQRQQRSAAERVFTESQAELVEQFPDFPQRDATRRRWLDAVDAALQQNGHPLHWWKGEASTTPATPAPPDEASGPSPEFRVFWAADRPEDSPWFRQGINPPELITTPGEFTVEPTGERLLAGLLPVGLYSHRLSQKHNGLFTSPPFNVSSDRISVRVIGGHGARVRLIPDQYPIGQGNIFPQATLNSSAPTWVTLDTAYRRGSMAYLEFAPAEDVGSRDRSAPGPGGRSFFGVTDIVFHDGPGVPEEGVTARTGLSREGLPPSRVERTDLLRQRLTEAVDAWRRSTLSEEQRWLLDAFVRSGLLPVTLDDLSELASTVAEYRRREEEIPVARRVPGVVEAQASDAPLLVRGDHLRPAAAVPRGYLELVSSGSYSTRDSGRLELARDLTRADNPLTARVTVNRVWLHLFGQGLVSTPDNFGRLGETPSHPELLDYLALRFQQQGWSFKELIRFLLLSETWRRSTEASPEAREKDPDNRLLSHARVRRLEAESMRDSLLAVSGRLDLTMGGPGANALAPPAEQRRRSVYLTIRRNFLNPFLTIFDAPKPFSTLGRRDTTNVPGQSLALLNDPFVIEQATQWAQAMLRQQDDEAARIDAMFTSALGRPPQDAERTASRVYLAELRRDHGPGEEVSVWRDFGQSLFNLKEFIYLR